MPLSTEDQITFPVGESILQQPPARTPVYVIPVCPDFQVDQQSNHTAQVACRPSPGDSWLGQLLFPTLMPLISLAYPLYASIRAIETKSISNGLRIGFYIR
ncbi:hypothetical protein POM88_019206 [Heracleum sosnowskyi]|uniref:Uncharacterized protein n=1 Tax=Heracleum sosnowskyi TaxID=360622 RepID=A0AAD8ITR0_9APIA|nr:hypothetical protein POM88_019206 [Heracleum sosnowskyi]